MHDIDLAARETGQALRMWPSTWHVASIGGFIAGGFGGIGSFRHGILRDPGNLLRARVMTVEREPRVIELQGDEIQQVHHAYGTNGVILDVEVALSPAVDWVHCTVLFETPATPAMVLVLQCVSPCGRYSSVSVKILSSVASGIEGLRPRP